MFEIRKNLDLRKILFTPKIFLKSRFHCSFLKSHVLRKIPNFYKSFNPIPTNYLIPTRQGSPDKAYMVGIGLTNDSNLDNCAVIS